MFRQQLQKITQNKSLLQSGLRFAEIRYFFLFGEMLNKVCLMCLLKDNGSPKLK